MPPAVLTDWVSPAKAITGRDHLAVQAVSEHLYTGLLPGITNVTDRARCYSFYPWFVWAFDSRYKKKGVFGERPTRTTKPGSRDDLRDPALCLVLDASCLLGSPPKVTEIAPKIPRKRR